MMCHQVLICHHDLAQQLLQQLRTLNCRSALVIHGKASFVQSGAQSIFEKISDLIPQLKLHFFSDFSTNPKLQQATDAVCFMQRHTPDVIISVGGGSALDLAKSTLAFSNRLEHNLDILMNKARMHDVSIPLIVIPTTSGSGSEATHFAALYHEGKKYALADSRLKPTLSLLDGSLTLTMPHMVAVASGLDVLCQSIESLWSVYATAESKSYAIKALSLWQLHCKKSIMTHDIQARCAMLEASYWAGAAIDISKTTAAHAYSYHLTQEYSIIHGYAVALCLPKILQASCTATAQPSFFGALAEITQALNIEDSVGALIQYFKVLFEDLELESSLVRLGCNSDEKIDNFISDVNLERLQNYPLTIDINQFKNIIWEHVYDLS